jgi:hypothetical protein
MPPSRRPVLAALPQRDGGQAGAQRGGTTTELDRLTCSGALAVCERHHPDKRRVLSGSLRSAIKLSAKTLFPDRPGKMQSADSDNVAQQVTALGYKALRLGGADLASVAARVAVEITTTNVNDNCHLPSPPTTKQTGSFDSPARCMLVRRPPGCECCGKVLGFVLPRVGPPQSPAAECLRLLVVHGVSRF